MSNQIINNKKVQQTIRVRLSQSINLTRTGTY